MPDICTVVSCSNRSNRERDRRYFRIPKVVEHKGRQYEEVTRQRRSKWLANLAIPSLSAHARVCSDHFVKGCPSKVFEEHDVDWAPTLKLGKPKGKSVKPVKPEPKRAKKRTETPENKTHTKTIKQASQKQDNSSTKTLNKKQKNNVVKKQLRTNPPSTSKPSRKRNASDDTVREDEQKPKQSRIHVDPVLPVDERDDGLPTHIRDEGIWPHTREREAEVLLDINNIIRIELTNHEPEHLEISEHDVTNGRTQSQDVGCQTELTCGQLEDMENELERVKCQLYELQAKMIEGGNQILVEY